MGERDLLVQIILKTIGVAAAGADIEGLDDKLRELTDKLSQSEFKAAGADVLSFGEAVKAATDPLAQATAKTLAFQAAIAGVAAVLANKAYQASKDYESALADLAKVIDGGMDAAKGYGVRLDETASQFARNGQELVAAMANFVQAGYDAEESFRLVTESTKLMVAGELDAADSSALLVSILKGFKAPASEAGEAVDLLNDVSNKYATNVKELAIGMAGLSPIAKQMGFSMAETAGLLTPVIEVYRSGSEAADALKTSLQQLTANTKPVKAALADIGVSQTDLNGKLRDGKDIFLDVARAFIGLSDAQKAYFTQELVGIEQAGRFGQTINSLGQYLAITADTAGRAGSAMREVETRLNSAEAAGKRADESFRQLAVTLGNAFKPQIRGVVEATGELAAAFDRSIKAGDLSPLLNAIKPQIAAIENLFRAMAGNLEEALSGVDWRPLADGLKAVSGELGEALGKLTEGMDLTTVEGLKNLLQALVNLLGNFSQFVAGAVDGLEPLLGALNTLFAAVSQNSPALADLAGEIGGLATSANQIVPVVSAFGSAIFGAIGNVAELALKIGLLVAAMRLLSAAGIPVLGILGRLAAAFFALNPAVASAATALAGFPGLVTALVAGAGTLGYGIGTLINQFVEWASGGRSVGSMLADLVDAVTGVNDEIARSATPEEMAIARSKRLAAEKERQAEATRKLAEEEGKARQKSEENIRLQNEKIKRAAEEEETAKRLEAQYAKLGLVYDRQTGQILRQGEATARQRQEARDLGAALDKLGIAANFMADRITAGGQETIATFRAITQNAQATADQIEAAFSAAISSAETEAEIKKILEAYREWARGAVRTAEEIDGAFSKAIDSDKTNRAVDEILKKFREWAVFSKATADQIDAAFKGAINSARTIEEADKIKAAYRAWTDQAKVGAADVEGATQRAETAIKELRKSTEGATLVSRLYAAAGVDALEIKRLEALAAGDLATALKIEERQRRNNIDALKEYGETVEHVTDIQAWNAQVTRDNAETLKRWAEEGKAAGEAFTGALSGWAQRLSELSPAAREAFDGFKEEAGAARDIAFDMVTALNGLGAGGFVRWANEVAIKALQIERSFHAQADAADALVARLDAVAEGGGRAAGGLGGLIVQAESAQGTLSLLDQSRLDALQAAIDRAKNSMDSLRQASEDALDTAQRALLQQQGDEKGLLELDRKRQLLDLERQLSAARNAGDLEAIANLEKALALQEKTYDLKRKQIKEEEDARKAPETRDTTGGATGQTGASAPPAQIPGGAPRGGGGNISLTINASNARLLDKGFAEDLARQLKPEFDRLGRLSA